MSSSVPTMIPNEPPPHDQFDNQDELDYRDLNSSRLNLDISADPSPMSSPMKSEIKHTFPSNHHNIRTAECKCNQNMEDEFGEFLSCGGLSKDEASPNRTSKACDYKESEINCDNIDDDDEVKGSEAIGTSDPVLCGKGLVPESESTSKDSESEIFEFGDFTSSNTAKPSTVEAASGAIVEETCSEYREANPEIDISPKQSEQTTNLDDNEFGDFSDFSSSAVPVQDPPQSICNYERLIKSIFDFGGSGNQSLIESEARSFVSSELPIDKLLETSPSSTWCHIRDFEGSHCLLFKWLNSIAQEHLFKSLSISKSTTILYSTKWGAVEVPKFAASLLDTPLQPQPLTLPLPQDFDEFKSHSDTSSSTRHSTSPPTPESGKANGASKSIPSNVGEDIIGLFH